MSWSPSGITSGSIIGTKPIYDASTNKAIYDTETLKPFD